MELTAALNAVRDLGEAPAPAGPAAPARVVIGADLVMTRHGRAITLHACDDATGRRLVGRFDSAAAAWRALDDLDAPDGETAVA